MTWIKINKNTIKSYLNKNSINTDIKIHIISKFNGMFDGTEMVDIIEYKNKIELLDIINKNGLNLYLCDGELRVYSSYLSYKIIDERMNNFIKEIKVRYMIDKI
jgi:hypothetical protein